MKICIDAFALNHLRNTGLYSYSYELINNLLTDYPQPHYNLITNSNGLNLPWKSKKGLSIDCIDVKRKQNDYSSVSGYIKDNKINLYHSLNNGFSIPEEKNCKFVVTMHDILPLKDKTFVDDKYYLKFMKSVPNALEKSDKIIAVSNFIHDELITYCNVPKDKVEVVYPLISHHFRPIPKVQCKELLIKKYNIEDDFLLYVGSVHERKNFPLLFSVFNEIVKIKKKLKLVIIGSITGKREIYYLKLKYYARKLGIEDNVLFVGAIDYKDMPYFYNASECFLNFSIYEGFPLTSVEARACNTPVVCNDCSSFKEVLGFYPTYINSENSKEVANQVLQLIQKEEKSTTDQLCDQSNGVHSMTTINKLVRMYEEIVYDL